MRGARGDGGQVPLVRFDVPESSEDHEKLARELASLAGLELDEIVCAERGSSIAVSLAIGPRRRAVVHPKSALDLERMLRALETLVPEDASRQYYQIERRNLAKDYAVAFATPRELRRLLERGWTVVVDPKLEISDDVGRIDGMLVRGAVDRWDDGSLKKIVLAEDTDVRGVHCAAGTVVRFVDGGVCEATLASPMTLRDCTLPPKTHVYFHYHSSIVGLARLASSVEVGGLVLPASTELEFDARARLTAATLGGTATPPSGYRDRGALSEGTVLELAEGKWHPASPEHVQKSITGRPRDARPKDARGALFGWALLVAFVGAPFAVLAGLSWLSSKSVGEACSRSDQCHSVLGDLCVAGLCAPSCETAADCPGDWTCEPTDGRGSACFAPPPLRRSVRSEGLTNPW